MKRKATDLIFISQINRDGKGVVIIDNIEQEILHSENEYYELSSLSLTNKTYLALGFNSYVVKLKNE